ncbi:hypothetical protein FACS1894166_12920 [Bacilli bacterium]|nr:hypothetical protein FACS1894166_12920 [Bacilli bacterium]
MALCKTKKIKALLGLVPTSLIVMGTGIGLATSIHHNNSKPVVFNNTTVSAMKAAMKSKMVSDGTPVAIDTLVPENSNVGNFINPTPDSANILDKLIV